MSSCPFVACWEVSQPGKEHPLTDMSQPTQPISSGSQLSVDYSDWLVCLLRSDVTVELPLLLMHPKPEGILLTTHKIICP